MINEQIYTLIVICILFLTKVSFIHGDDSDHIKIPNPFNDSENKQGYYVIESYQVTSSHRFTTRIDVTEYFSLKTGITYSIQTNKDDLSSDPILIVVDGFNVKSYIVRDYSTNRVHSNEIECEIDHLHHNRQVFPWQYKYETKKQRPGFVYGVGAIWLNAIEEQKNVCSLHFDQITHPTKNAWKLWKRDIDIELLFDKASDENEDYSMKLLDSVHLIKKHAIQTTILQDTHSVGVEKKDIYVSGFRYIANTVDDKTLSEITLIIGKCRRMAKDHRNFPSLLATISVSPQRMFSIDYMQTTYPEARGYLNSGTYDATRFRHVFDHEYRTEWFSFIKQMSSISYMSLEEKEELNQQINDTSSYHSDQVDIFIKRFTDTVMAQRAKSVTYHLVEQSDKFIACYPYHEEPVPSRKYMIRPINFYTRNRTKVKGLLTGIGALLMNAADSHRMQFNLYRKNIDVVRDAANIKETVRISADEWRWNDKESGRILKFFFQQARDGAKYPLIQDLVRIDICDDGIDQDSIDNNNDKPFGLIYRYDIFNIATGVSDEELDSALPLFSSLPQECFLNKPDHLDDDIETDEEDDDDDDDEDYHHDHDKGDYDDSDTDVSEFNEDEKETLENNEQDEDNYEFDMGNLVEHLDFPTLYNYLDGRAAYAIESEIQRGNDKFYLKERVDLESEEAIISLYGEEDKQKPFVEFHINYNSELIFKLTNKDECILLTDDIDQPEWLKLLSSRMKYYKSPSIASDGDSDINSNSTGNDGSSTGKSQLKELIESNKIRLFGVGALWRQASESDSIRYEGFTTIEENGGGGGKFRQLEWILRLDEVASADETEIVFKFRYDLEKHKEGRKRKIRTRLVDLIHLERIEFQTLEGEENKATTIMEINLKSIDYPNSANLDSKQWELPSFCFHTLNEASRKARTQYHREDVTIPSLSYILNQEQQQQRVYTMQYTISHTPLSGSQYTPSSSIQLPIVEEYNLDLRRGKMIIGNGIDRRFVFIDELESKIFTYLERTDDCKRLGSLNNLVDLGNNFIIKNQMNSGISYGLGALWNRLARAQNGLLKVMYRYDERGFKRETRMYRLVISHVEAYTHITEFIIHMTFIEDFNNSDNNSNNDSINNQDGNQEKTKKMKLQSIDIFPKKVRGTNSKWNHRTTITVASFSSIILEDMETLPAACERQGRLGEVPFPKLSELISSRRQFHMRSELTSTRRLEDKGKRMLTLVEEWIYEQNYRFRTLNLAQNYDILIYGTTRESFDFRFPYQCTWNLWKSIERKQMNPEEQRNVLDFWSGKNDTILLRPSLVNFAPAALWLAAERNPDNIKLVSSMDIAPLPKGNDSLSFATEARSHSEREMRLVTWQVTSPATSSKATWSYRLIFEQVSVIQPDGKDKEWHILDRIELEESDPYGNKFVIELDVVNYKYLLTQDEISEKFSLPEAHGCKRSESLEKTLLETRDELQLELNHQHKITYEASLEMMDYEQKKRTYSTLSGISYSTGRNLGETIQVQSHHMSSRNADGSRKVSKEIYDKFSSIIYSIDSQSGICDINHNEQYNWQLQFSPLDQIGNSSKSKGDSGVKIVQLDDSLFKILFLNTMQSDFKPVNRWTSNGWHLSSYELELNNLRLFENVPVGQPATIVRRFYTYGQEPRLVIDNENQFYQRQNVETKVYLFDNKQRNKVVGKFIISLNTFNDINLLEVMEANTVEECFNNGQQDMDKQVGSFDFEFKLNEQKLFDWIQYNSMFTEREFLLKLLRKASLLPTQFVSMPQIRQHQRDNEFRLNFQLLDAPTAIRYFKRSLHSTMVDDLLAHSEIRLLDDLIDCSRWCDKESCLALSYCSGRVCRILTDTNLREADLSRIQERITTGSPDESCDYYYCGGFRPSHLEQFSQLVRADLARVPASSIFGLDLDDQYVMPSEFYEQISFDSNNYADDYKDSMDSNHSTKSNSLSYITQAERDVELDLVRIMNDKSITVLFDQTNNFANCLELCIKFGCSIVSYDEERSTCTMLKGRNEIKNLLLTKSTDRIVMIAIRDHRDEYYRFGNTAFPTAYRQKLANYTAVECASACSTPITGHHDDDDDDDNDDKECLSFDYCPSESLCLLQETHILSNSFDRTQLELVTGKNQTVCEHYSKLLLVDFDELVNQQLATEVGARQKSIDKERCALECRQEDQCLAFEYCIDSQSQERSTSCCRLVLLTNGTHTNREPFNLGPEEILNQTLIETVNSSSCSVFVLKYERAMEQQNQELSMAILEAARRDIVDDKQMNDLISRENIRSPQPYITMIFYLIIALCTGTIIQFIFIRLAGRSILFDY